MTTVRKTVLLIEKLTYSLALIVFLLFTSCEKDDPIKTDDVGQVPESIVQKLNKAGFDTSEGLFKFQDGYIVEYDIFLTEEKIDALLLEGPPVSNGRTEHYRTNNLVQGMPRTLLIFMDPTFNAGMQNAFDVALARYNNVGIGLTFQRTTSAAAANIRINAQSIPTQPDGTEILGISAGFPTGGNPASPITLNTRFFNTGTIRVDAITVITHEIGHAIGFRHTDFMNRTFSCGRGGNEGDAGVGAVHVPGTPTGPAMNSWMLACSNNSDRPFTPDDVTSLRTVYPVPFTNWEGTEGMTTLNGLIYIVQNNRLHKVNPDGTYTLLGNANWAGTEGMTSLDGYLYISQNNRLHKVNPSDGSYILLGNANWAGTEGMTSLDGYLYISQNNRLHKVNPGDGSYILLGNANWAGTEGMTSLDGYLYISQNNRLHKVNPSDGSYILLGNANWAGTEGMTPLNGSLYISQNNRLHIVSTADGSYTYAGAANWLGTEGMTTLNGFVYIVQNKRLHRVNADGTYILL